MPRHVLTFAEQTKDKDYRPDAKAGVAMMEFAPISASPARFPRPASSPPGRARAPRRCRRFSTGGSLALGDEQPLASARLAENTRARNGTRARRARENRAGIDELFDDARPPARSSPRASRAPGSRISSHSPFACAMPAAMPPPREMAAGVLGDAAGLVGRAEVADDHVADHAFHHGADQRRQRARQRLLVVAGSRSGPKAWLAD